MKPLLLAGLLLLAAAAPAAAWDLDIGSAIGSVISIAQSISINDEEEHAIGQQCAQQMLAQHGLYQDARAQYYVTLVGQAVLKSAPARPYPVEFAIINSGEVNAFACPGGPVLLTRGLWEQLASEAELAGILGHELAHVTQRHAINEVKKTNLLSGISSEALSQTGYGALAPVSEYIVKELFAKGFSRDYELEADRLGTAYAGALGYYPLGLAEFLDRCLGGSGERPSLVGALYSTHPPVGERVAALRAAVDPEQVAAAPQLAERLLQWRTPAL